MAINMGHPNNIKYHVKRSDKGTAKFSLPISLRSLMYIIIIIIKIMSYLYLLYADIAELARTVSDPGHCYIVGTLIV